MSFLDDPKLNIRANCIQNICDAMYGLEKDDALTRLCCWIGFDELIEISASLQHYTEAGREMRKLEKH